MESLPSTAECWSPAAPTCLSAAVRYSPDNLPSLSCFRITSEPSWLYQVPSSVLHFSPETPRKKAQITNANMTAETRCTDSEGFLYRVRLAKSKAFRSFHDGIPSVLGLESPPFSSTCYDLLCTLGYQWWKNAGWKRESVTKRWPTKAQQDL